MKRHSLSRSVVWLLLSVLTLLVVHPVLASPPIVEEETYAVIEIIDNTPPQQVGPNLMLAQTLHINNSGGLERWTSRSFGAAKSIISTP